MVPWFELDIKTRVQAPNLETATRLAEQLAPADSGFHDTEIAVYDVEPNWKRKRDTPGWTS
jgi:hypothetical protein